MLIQEPMGHEDLMATACGNCAKEMSAPPGTERAFRRHQERRDQAFCSPACEEAYIGRMMARGARPKRGTTYVVGDLEKAAPSA